MTHVPHQLADTFPTHKDTIRMLKQSSPHFARLAAEYEEVNRALHRYETRVEPIDERPEKGLRIKRMILRDQLYAMMKM